MGQSKDKRYIGSLNSEVYASKIYDKMAILKYGLKVRLSIFVNAVIQAKTNYTYSK